MASITTADEESVEMLEVGEIEDMMISGESLSPGGW